jgi:hypothetical protein
MTGESRVHRTAIQLGFLALASCGVVALARPAAAYSLDLEWTAPSACPSGDALRLAVERLLGEPLREGTGIRAFANVAADDDARFTLTLVIDTSEGQRTRSVRTDTCESALEVAAFAIALALNPDLHADAPPGAFSESDASPLPIPVPPVPPVAPAPAPTTRPDVSKPPARMPIHRRSESTPSSAAELWVAAAALVDSSLLPNPALGVSAAVELQVLGWLRLGVRPGVFLPQNERLATGAGGRFSLWSVQASACAGLGSVVGVCPVFQYGVLRAEGRGVAPRLEQESALAVPGLAVQGSVALSTRTSARVALTGLLPLSRDVFVVRDGLVHRLPQASFELSVGGATLAF